MLEAQLNGYLARALDRSPRARELCNSLDGRRLRVILDGVPGALWLTVSGGAVEAAHERSDAGAGGSIADVTIRGSLLGLLALTGTQASETVMRGAASVEGDEALAQQFQEMARLLRPDFEAGMGRIVGRVPAHLAARALAFLAGWGREARESVMRNTADYLAHESRDLVPRAEAESHFLDIEALRSQIALAEARMAKIAERVTALAGRARL